MRIVEIYNRLKFVLILLFLLANIAEAGTVKKISHEWKNINYDSIGIPSSIQTLIEKGNLLFGEKEYAPAITKYYEAYKFLKSTQNASGEILTLQGIATAYYAINEKKMALYYIKQAFETAKQRGSSDELAEVGNYYTEYLEDIGPYLPIKNVCNDFIEAFLAKQDQAKAEAYKSVVKMIDDSLASWTKFTENNQYVAPFSNSPLKVYNNALEYLIKLEASGKIEESILKGRELLKTSLANNLSEEYLLKVNKFLNQALNAADYYGIDLSSLLKWNEIELRETLFPIAELNFSKGYYTAKVPFAKWDNIQVGKEGVLLGGRVIELGDHPTKFIAKFKVISVENQIATIEFKPYRTDQKQFLPQIVDYATIAVPYPYITEKSYLQYVTPQKYYVTISSGDYLYDRHIVSLYSDNSIEKLINKIAIADIKSYESVVKEGLSKNPEWGKKREKGMFKGLSLYDKMKTLSNEDLRRFWAYVKDLPGGFNGKIETIIAGFSSWIFYDATLVQSLFFEELNSAKTPDDLQKLYLENKDDIKTYNLHSSIIDTIKYRAKNGINYDMLLEKIKNLAAYYDDDTVKAKQYFDLAQFYYSQLNYTESINAYQSSIACYKRINYFSNIASAYHNIGLNYDGLKQYDKSVMMFDTSLAYARLATDRDHDTFYEFIGSGYWAKGYSLGQIGRYNESLQSYLEAVKMYDSSSTARGAKDKNTVINNIGLQFNKQGKNVEALEYFNKYYEYSRLIVDSTAMAQAIANIALATFDNGDYTEAINAYERSYNINKALGNKSEMGYALSNIGQAYWNLGKFEEAIDAHNRAIKLRSEIADTSGMGYSFSMLGGLYSSNGSPVLAEESYQKSLKLYQAVSDNAGIARVNNNLGEYYKSIKLYDKSIECYEKALGLYKLLKDDYSLGSCNQALGYVYIEYQNYDLAEQYLKKGIEIQKNTMDKAGLIYSMINLGYTEYWFKQKFDTSLVLYKEALSLSKELNNQSTIAYCFWSLGKLYFDKGLTNDAVATFDSALSLYKKIDEKSKYGNVEIDLATAYAQMGKAEEALKLCDSIAVLAKLINNNTMEASSYVTKSYIVLHLGEFKKSKELIDKAKDVYSQVENLWNVASLGIAYGNLYNMQNDYKEAMRNYSIADSIYASLSDNYNRATPINNIGTVYFWQGDYKPALTQFYQALAILDSLNFRGEFYSLVLANIGEAYSEIKDFDNAKMWLFKALNASNKVNSPRNMVSVNTLLANIYAEEAKYDSAKVYAKNSYELSKNSSDISRVIQSALISGKLYYLLKDYSLALKYLNESIETSKRIESDKLLYQALLYKSLVEKELGQKEAGLANLIDAVKSLDRIKDKIVGGEKASKMFSSGEIKVKIYANIIGFYIEKGKADSAFYYIEKSNNDAIKQQFSKIEITPDNKEQADALEKEKDLKKKLEGQQIELEKENAKPDSLKNLDKIKKLKSSISIAQESYMSFLDSLVVGYPNLARYLEKNPTSFTESNSSLPEDLAVVYYLLGDEQLYAFIAKRDSVAAKVINIGKSELEKKIVKLYRSLKDSFIPQSLGDMNVDTFEPILQNKQKETKTYLQPFTETSKELYDVLIRPILSDINHKKNIAIIPFGKLFYLPFEVLISSGSDKQNKFLLNDHNIFYVNSLANITGMNSDKSQGLKITAFGNADNTLPKAEVEVQEINDLYKDAQVFLRDSATVDKVKSLTNKFNVLHFATHGNLDYVDIRNSFLSMAKGKNSKEEGKLTIKDVWSLINLKNYNLVTLSACKTAVSDEVVEGWMINPADAFFKIGVKTVVASLWKVDDDATAELMKLFYTNLKTLPKLEALQKAKSDLSHNPKYAYPYYWGAFVLVGSYK